MDELPKDLPSMAGALLSGLVVGGLWLRSKLSRDSVARANDQAEINILEVYRSQNAELRASLVEVTNERNKLYRDVGEMAGSIRALEETQRVLQETINTLREEVASLKARGI